MNKATFKSFTTFFFVFFFSISLSYSQAFTLSGCPNSVYDGDYVDSGTDVGGCDCYVKSGGGVFVFFNTFFTSWLGSTTSCGSIIGAETLVNDNSADCDITTYFATNCTGVLPVELSVFEATQQEKSVQLNWTTESELNNLGFEIERSGNGETAEVIGWIDGKGTVSNTTNYTFVDRDIHPNSFYYYRLKQIDRDGTFEYSKLIAIKTKEGFDSNTIEIYPNPFANQLNIRNAIGQVKIYNLLGQEIWNRNLINNSSLLNLTGLNDGQYFLEIIQENGNHFLKKIIKN